MSKSSILLISNDTGLRQDLLRAASPSGRIVVRACAGTEAFRTAGDVKPAVVLLDLDLPQESAWEIAYGLLHAESCSPIILLTARCEQLDVRTAVRAGTVFDKSAGSCRLLEVVYQMLAAPKPARAEHNARQRIVVRWLRPSGWSVPVTSLCHAKSRIE